MAANKDSRQISETIQRHVRSLAPQLIALRRHLHQFPEVSEREYSTTEFLTTQLRQIGLNPVLAEDRRGLWADIGNSDGRSGNIVAMRGDIDALPLQTELTTSYASMNRGVMHACGHDAHATMVWGGMAILKQMLDDGELPGELVARGIFQPAEETSRGGPHMIRSGALEDVRATIAFHVDPARPVGTFGYRDNEFTAGCDTFRLVIHGQAGHGARPHLTGDSIAAASSWIQTAYIRVPRCHDARDTIVLNVGQIQGGNAANIVPSEVELKGTLRTLSMEGARQAKSQLHQITDAISMTYPVKAELSFSTHTPPVSNDTIVNASFHRAAAMIVGAENVHLIEKPSMGAEDFAFMSQTAPAAMMRIGVAGVELGNQPLHTPLFDIDESVLSYGAAVFALAVIELSK